MRTFLANYLVLNARAGQQRVWDALEARWQTREEAIRAVFKQDPTGARGVPSGSFHNVEATTFRLDAANIETVDLAELVHSMLHLFHNMRAALHVPGQSPDKPPPASGPARSTFGQARPAGFPTGQAP